MVNLTALMRSTRGHPSLAIGLIDGPVATAHPEFSGARLLSVPGRDRGRCARSSSVACLHGTLVAGILVARRGSGAPAICPDCTLVVRPIFTEATALHALVPTATPEELASAIVDCLDAGVRIMNLSVALTPGWAGSGVAVLEQALHRAAHRGVLVVAAAGNQGSLGSTAITRHPWVISVIGCDRRGLPLPGTNLGTSIGRRGLSAPGEEVTSLKATGGMVTTGGTSVAAPFVTGALALVWTKHPGVTAGQVRSALLQAHPGRRSGVVPAMLDASALCEALRQHGAPTNRKTA